MYNLLGETVMNRIKQLREEKGMSQVRLSIELEVSQETVSAYENGKHYPSVQSLIKLSDIFGVSCDYILGLSEERHNVIYHSLNEQERKLFNLYKALSAQNQDLVTAYAQGLYDSSHANNTNAYGAR